MDLFRWLRGSSNHELKLVDKSEVPLIDISAFKERIAHLQDLDDEHKKRLEDRWLHMVRWWDQRSTESKWKYQLLRVTVLIGGVLIPMLVSLQTSTLMAKHTDAIQLLAILVGLLIAIAAGLEEIYHFGDVWREKRSAAEHLKIEGWRFIHLVGPYSKADHKEAYPEFAANVELLIEREIKDYLTAVSPDEKGEIQKLINERISALVRVQKSGSEDDPGSGKPPGTPPDKSPKS